MLSLPQRMDWRTWRWRSVVSAMRPTTRGLTLRELLDSLEGHPDRGSRSPQLERLIALMQQDLAISVHFPERRGGPDTRRSLGAWSARYNHLEGFLAKRIAAVRNVRHAALDPDDAGNRALSAAEYEGWPIAFRVRPPSTPAFDSLPTRRTDTL